MIDTLDSSPVKHATTPGVERELELYIAIGMQ